MAKQSFDALVDIYDALIDWTARLRYETPLLRHLVDQVTGDRVLDAACGTGRHAELLSSWGMQVEAADLSGPMLQRGRERVGENSPIHWVQRSYTEPSEQGLSFDLILCIGNSLALAPNSATAKSALRCLTGQLRPGGLLLLQVHNTQRFEDQKCTWQKCKHIQLEGRSVVVIKGIHRSSADASVELVAIDPDGPEIIASHSAPLLSLDETRLSEMARAAGAGTVSTYGNFERAPFDPHHSTDLILVLSR